MHPGCYQNTAANNNIDISADFVAAGIDNSFAIANGNVYSWGFSADHRTGLGTNETIEQPTRIKNSAVIEKVITFAGCGGQFSLLAGPSTIAYN